VKGNVQRVDDEERAERRRGESRTTTRRENV